MAIFNDTMKAASTIHTTLKGGAAYYAGITDNPQRRLGEHQVDPANGKYSWAQCATDAISRDAERILHEIGYEGGTGGGDELSVFVYAYKITPATCEDC